MDTQAVEIDFVPTARELRQGAIATLLHSRSFYVFLAVLAIFEFLVFGVWGHSLFWGIVFAIGSCLLLSVVMVVAMDARLRPLRQPTHISVTEAQVQISRPGMASQVELSQFRKWLTRNGNYVLLGRSQPRMFVLIPRRAVTSGEDRLRTFLIRGIGRETVPWLSG